MRKTMTIMALAAVITAGAQVPYKVIVPVPEEAEGTMIYLTSYDTGERIDSVKVAGETVVFTGEVDEPYFVRFIGEDGSRYGNMVLEQGTSAISEETRMGAGTMLNDQLRDIIGKLDGIAESINAAQSEDEANNLIQSYLTAEAQAIRDNADNPIGFFLFMDYATSVDLVDALKILDENPSLKEYKRVQRFLESAERKMSTSEGKTFVDFEVTYDGKTSRLSDYVGKGDYVLVDFWASWCGPCMREIENLKQIYADYNGQGLKVLGVAVWDRPEDTQAAITRKQIPWECIINAQTIPTDLYGIQGIPCVILFGPDGTILSRDKQGSALRADVEKYFRK